MKTCNIMIYLFTNISHSIYHYFYNIEDASIYCVIVTNSDYITYWSSNIDGWLQDEKEPFNYELPNNLIHNIGRLKMKDMIDMRKENIIYEKLL
jgi:hypothetical protein